MNIKSKNTQFISALITILISYLTIFSGCALAENSDVLLPSHPTSYKVAKTDTLWDVSARFLKEPWRWSQVWRAKSNLIYPGDVIVVHYDGDNNPYLSIQTNMADINTDESFSESSSAHVTNLSPQVRVLAANKAIPTLPLSAVRPFLNDSLVLERNELNNAPFVMATDDEHLLVGEGFRFFAVVRGAKLGDAYSIYQPGQPFTNPDTKAFLGKEAIFLGRAEIVQLGRNGEASTFVLRSGRQEINVGDKLLPYKEEQIEPYFYPRYPDGNANGKILAVLGGLNQVAQYQVVAITGGDDQHRQVGDVLAIYQTNKNEPASSKATKRFKRMFCQNAKVVTLLPQRVGGVMVFKTFQKVSFALVTNSIRPIYLQDEVKRP